MAVAVKKTGLGYRLLQCAFLFTTAPVEYVEAVLPDRLRARDTGDHLGRPIETRDATVLVDREDAVRDAIEHHVTNLFWTRLIHHRHPLPVIAPQWGQKAVWSHAESKTETATIISS